MKHLNNKLQCFKPNYININANKTNKITDYFKCVYPYISKIYSFPKNTNFLYLLCALNNDILCSNKDLITSIWTFYGNIRNCIILITPNTSYDEIVICLPLINEVWSPNYFQDNKFLAINKYDKYNWISYYKENYNYLETIEYLEINNTGGLSYGFVEGSQPIKTGVVVIWYYLAIGSGCFYKPTQRIVGLNKFDAIIKSYTLCYGQKAYNEFFTQYKNYLAVVGKSNTEKCYRNMLQKGTSYKNNSYFNLNDKEFDNFINWLISKSTINNSSDKNDKILSGVINVSINVSINENILDEIPSSELRYLLYAQLDPYSFTDKIYALDFFCSLILGNKSVVSNSITYGLIPPLKNPIDTLIFTCQWNYYGGWNVEMVSNKFDNKVDNKNVPTFYYKNNNKYDIIKDFPISDKWNNIETSYIPATLVEYINN